MDIEVFATLKLNLQSPAAHETMMDFLDEINHRFRHDNAEFWISDFPTDLTTYKLEVSSSEGRSHKIETQFWSFNDISCSFSGDTSVIEAAQSCAELARTYFAPYVSRRNY